jgi:hypothetical protein
VPYSHTSYLQLRQALAARLGDSGNVFWTDAELGRYTLEALRTWGLYATYWRSRGIFATQQNVAFYDVTSTSGSSAQMSALLGGSLRDTDLITDICYALMEIQPSGNPLAWNGTSQFLLTDLTTALTRRRDQFLAETGAVLANQVIPSGVPVDGRVFVPDTTIDIRRAAWKDDTNAIFTLPRVDELQLDYAMTGWNINRGTPNFWTTIASPPLIVQLAPPPLASGSLDLLTVSSGVTLDGSGVLLGIPDDFAPVLKWGALADLLGKDGEARDPDRAAYCELRWQQGVELARINPTVIRAEIQGVENIVDDLWALDRALPGWQSQSNASQPTVVGTAGRNMVALANMPDANGYSVTLDVVQKSIVPSVDADSLQVGREVLNVLLDYAEHLAAFKMQGVEWRATDRAMQNLIRHAAIHNEKLQASALFKEIMWPTQRRYGKDLPRRTPDKTEAEVSA